MFKLISVNLTQINLEDKFKLTYICVTITQLMICLDLIKDFLCKFKLA